MRAPMRTVLFCILILSVVFALSCGPGTPADPHPVVIMKTTFGTMEITLDAEKAPRTVKNFLQYVDEGFYTNTVIHRVVPGSIIQGGGFTPAMLEKETRKPIKSEAANGLRNRRGTIAMARDDRPNSATAQFFINVKDNPGLDHRDDSPEKYGYAVFGEVTVGMEIADAIAALEVGGYGRPDPLVVIYSISRK